MTLVYKLVFAFLVTGCATWGFYRSCKLEEENGAPMNLNGRIYIWISPLMFPITLLILPAVWFLTGSTDQSLGRIIPLLSNVLIFLSIYFVVLLFILPIIRRYFSARLCAVFWMVPVFVYYFTCTRFDVNFIPRVLIPVKNIPIKMILLIWIAGFMGIMIYQIISHLLFRRRLLRNASMVTDQSIIELWNKERDQINLNLAIPLMYCDCIQTPLSMGIFKKTLVTLIPRKSYSKEEMQYLLRHELHHIQRSDVETKIFLGFSIAFCWFNPLVWIAVNKASEDLELSCDEIVLKDASESERRHYAELLLKTAGQGRGYTTCLSASASALRYRLKKVVHPIKRRNGILIFAVVLFVSCMADGMISFSGNLTTIEDIALSDHAATQIGRAFLCVGENEEITNIDLSETTDVGKKQIQKIQNMKVQELYTSYQYTETYPYISFSMQDGTDITITKDYMCVRKYSQKVDEMWELLSEKYYAVQSDISPEDFK